MRARGLQFAERILAAVGFGDREALGFQAQGDDPPQFLVVVDQQQAVLGRRLSHCLAAPVRFR